MAVSSPEEWDKHSESAGPAGSSKGCVQSPEFSEETTYNRRRPGLPANLNRSSLLELLGVNKTPVFSSTVIFRFVPYLGHFL